MELLTLNIHILETNEVISENTIVRMILFDGECTGNFFHGTIINGGVDTQIIKKKEYTSLSARYIVEGYDNTDTPCRLFIENNAKSNTDIITTTPKIYTDSTALKWMEQKKLTGTLEFKDDNLIIHIQDPSK